MYCQLNQGCNIEGAIRLVGGASELEGRAELCTPDMTWTAVCGEVFSLNEARVICRMLGYSQMSRLIHAITCWPPPPQPPTPQSQQYYIHRCYSLPRAQTTRPKPQYQLWGKCYDTGWLWMVFRVHQLPEWKSSLSARYVIRWCIGNKLTVYVL